MKILVTGACGNIGSSVVEELRRQGHLVRCLDLPTAANRKKARTLAATVEVIWSDIRDVHAVDAAVQGQDVVVHLAFIIPPHVDDDPATASEVNIDGTTVVLNAVRRHASRILFASTLDVFGRTQHLDPPRKVTDSVAATDEYSKHKIKCEELVRQSPHPWAIYRFADVPPKQRRSPHPLMFAIPLEQRIEVVHVDDVGLAVANGISSDQIWGQTWLIGGGGDCQVRYRDLLNRSLAPLGIAELPEKAFSTTPYCTDWLDTTKANACCVTNATALTRSWNT
jgi:nucleoside-diphosphate-sugar epimerase